MTTRKDELQRLRVASPCQSPWEEMHGDGRRRHCMQCDRQVYDFVQLTAREAAGLIEASGGALCARLTRDGAGRLVTLEPPFTAEPLATRRAAPLVAAAVAAVLGVSGAAWAEAAAAAPPAAEQGTGKRPAESPPQRTDDPGSVLTGTLATEGGEPIPNAEVRVYNQLDRRERTARTDDQGTFSFATLPAGIYRLDASLRGQGMAHEEDVLLRAGETGRVGLTVPSDTWQRIVAGAPVEMAMGGALAVTEDPVRRLYGDAGLVVFGVAGKSVVVRREEYTWEVRTDLVLSSVVKGDTRERVISVFHDQMPDEPAESEWQPGDRMLAFLDPREAENGRSLEGYVAHTAFGLKKLSEAEVAAYGRRLEALARIARKGAARPADALEWLVATAEEPATRREAMQELGPAVGDLEQQAERHKAPVDHYAQGLRDVLADFLGAGGRPEGEADPAVLAAFLTDAQRERLTAALLRTPHATAADLDLYEIVSRWHDDRLLPWLTDRLKAAELADGASRRVMSLIAKARDDQGLADLVTAGEETIEALGQERSDASDDATRQRLDAQVTAAEEGLQQRFLEALGRRRGA
jgi:hypothetical protein